MLEHVRKCAKTSKIIVAALRSKNVRRGSSEGRAAAISRGVRGAAAPWPPPRRGCAAAAAAAAATAAAAAAAAGASSYFFGRFWMVSGNVSYLRGGAVRFYD